MSDIENQIAKLKGRLGNPECPKPSIKIEPTIEEEVKASALFRWVRLAATIGFLALLIWYLS